MLFVQKRTEVLLWQGTLQRSLFRLGRMFVFVTSWVLVELDSRVFCKKTQLLSNKTSTGHMTHVGTFWPSCSVGGGMPSQFDNYGWKTEISFLSRFLLLSILLIKRRFGFEGPFLLISGFVLCLV